jgi:hypothetical protein
VQQQAMHASRLGKPDMHVLMQGGECTKGVLHAKPQSTGVVGVACMPSNGIGLDASFAPQPNV